MRSLAVVYFTVLFAGLAIVQCRTGWTIFSSKRGSGFPTVMAIIYSAFMPESMQYVATSDLKAGHELREVDMAADRRLPAYLLSYLPRKSSLVGKYLEAGIIAGKPIRPQNLGTSPTITPEKDTYIVYVRLRQQPSSPRLLQSDALVTLSFSATTERLEGTIVGDGSVRANPESSPKSVKTER